MAEVWTRFWNGARDAAGISWAIDKGVDLQKVRQRAGHGSLEVTSRYAAILDERDTSLADGTARRRPTLSQNVTERWISSTPYPLFGAAAAARRPPVRSSHKDRSA